MSSPRVIPITIAHQTEPVRPVLTLTTGHQSSNAEPAGGEAQWVVRIPTSFLDATEHPLSDRSRYLFLVLESLARNRTYCWPTNEQLCRIMGRCDRAIRFTLDELETTGYIHRIHHEQNQRVRIGIILTRRANPGQCPAADTPEALEAAKSALRDRRDNGSPRNRRNKSADDRRNISSDDADRRNNCADENTDGRNKSADDRRNNCADRIKKNFEEDTASKPAIHALADAHAREGTGSDNDPDEPFHAPPPPAPTARVIDLTPPPTRRDAMVASCDGSLPGTVVVDEEILDRTYAFIDRFFPMQDDLKRFVSEHKRVFPTAWLFQLMKRVKARGYKGAGRNLLLRITADWLRDGKPDPGPEDRYDDDMRPLPAPACPQVEPTARPAYYRPENAPVKPPPRPEMTPEAKRRYSRGTRDATAGAAGKQGSAAASIREIEARAARARKASESTDVS